MRRRDAAAAELHGRLISRLFRHPLTKRQIFRGELHFRGVQYRPQYFLAVYDDGDWQFMSMQTAKKNLKSQGTQLPDGVVIPERATVAHQQQQQQMYSLLTASADTGVVTAAAVVPNPAVQLIVDFMQLSMQVSLHDPVTQNAVLASQLQQSGYQLSFSAHVSHQAGIIAAPADTALSSC